MVQYGLPLAEAVPLLAALLSLPLTADYAPLTMSPERQKQQMLRTLLTIVLHLAAQQPLLFVMEDVHWVDPSALEFLTLLVDQGPTARILALLTFRPDFTPPWTGRSHLTQVTVPRLPRRQAVEVSHHVAHGKLLPAEVVEQIVAKTDGVPLFVEELTRMLLESGLLQAREERSMLTGPLPPLAIPTTLHDSLMARLDRLAAVKGLAQLAATLGREFSYALLHAVSPWDEGTVQRGLHQLVEAELLYQRGLPPQATYLFKHALIQDTAYQSLLRSTRQQYHQRIAQVLSTWTEFFLPSPLMGEGEGGGAAGPQSHTLSHLSPHPNLPPPGGKEREVCTKFMSQYLETQFPDLAQAQPDPAHLLLAHYQMGSVLFLRGEPAAARTHQAYGASLRQCSWVFPPRTDADSGASARSIRTAHALYGPWRRVTGAPPGRRERRSRLYLHPSVVGRDDGHHPLAARTPGETGGIGPPAACSPGTLWWLSGAAQPSAWGDPADTPAARSRRAGGVPHSAALELGTAAPAGLCPGYGTLPLVSAGHAAAHRGHHARGGHPQDPPPPETVGRPTQHRASPFPPSTIRTGSPKLTTTRVGSSGTCALWRGGTPPMVYDSGSEHPAQASPPASSAPWRLAEGAAVPTPAGAKGLLYFLSMEARRDQRWTSTTHRASLEAAEATRTRLIVEAAKGRERAGEERSQQPADATVLSRWIGPSLRVLIGTGLATANAAIGVTAGLTATIATIGATAVPTYVGVATSIYTGLAQAADGLEKIGRHK